MTSKALNVAAAAIVVWMPVFSIGCRGSSNAPPPAQSGAASETQTTALPHGTVREDLTFTGDISGRMETARHGSAYTCGGMGSIYIVDPVLGAINGKSYELGIQITGFKGPGTCRTGGELTPGSAVAAISIWLKPEGTENASRSKSGTIVVNQDRRSGTLDADLAGKLGAFHIAGAWTCPPDF